MRKQSRLLLAGSLIPATLMVCTGSGAAAQEAHAHVEASESTRSAPLRSVKWSDPAAWPDRKVPAAGDAVTIARDVEVVLDVTPPALRSLTIDGRLSFATDRDIGLETEWIYLRGGELQIGSEGKPYTRQATITLTDTVPDENINTMGDRGIMLMGGTLNLHGDREHTWSKLARTAEAGANRIQVLDASGWRIGDEIVLASTDFDPRQAEKRKITAIEGSTITLDRPLEYMHFGEITFGVDQRGEVGLLTRNIRIRASEDAEQSYFGGHIMAMAGSKVYVSGVELSRMGQHLTLARYPIHWHLIGEGQGQYIKNSAIHDTYSRCVTVHGTNNTLVENNVTFNTVGHCFFLEDAVETGNQFISNLGIQTKCHPTLPCLPTNLAPGERSPLAAAGQTSKDVLLPSDNTASTFWITNPDNIYRNNVAAGSDQIGFWFALPEHPIGQFEGSEVSKNTWPRRMPVREFSGNVAHSNFDGVMFDRGPRPDNTFSVVGSNYHTAHADPTDETSRRLESVFENFTGYKNRNGAIWARGELHTFRNLRLADNAIGYTHAAGRGPNAYTSRVLDSVFVGESANVGNPRTPQEVAYGRSLPTAMADFPIRGYEYYDFRHDVENVRFVNFEDNATRKASAMSYLMYTSFGASTTNSSKGLIFENAKPVYFPAVDRRWGNDFGTQSGWTGAVIHDRDGSLAGLANSYVVIDNGIAANETCEVKPTWNAAVCQGDMGRVNIGNVGGAAPGGAPAAPAAGATPPPPPAPITLSRNGRELAYTGETTILSGSEVKVDTARKAVSLNLREMDKGSSVVFQLPGFKTAASGTRQSNLAALRNASSTSYFNDGSSLWVKLVVAAPSGPMVANTASVGPRTSIDVSR